jgi:Tol biopolymer transport system component
VQTLQTLPIGGGPPLVSAIAAPVAHRIAELHLRLGQFVWSPQRTFLFFEGQSDLTRNIWRIGVDPVTLEWTSGPDRLTAGSGIDGELSISTDGTRLAFGSRVERTQIQSFALEPSGPITGSPAMLTPEGADAQIVDLSPTGRQFVYSTARHDRDELWIHSVDQREDRLRSVEPNGSIVQPRWSRDGQQLAYMRRVNDSPADRSLVLLAASSGEPRVVASTQALRMIYDWSPDNQSFLVGCRAGARAAVCILPISPAHAAGQSLALFAADSERDLYGIRVSPDGRWVTVSASADSAHAAISVIPAGGGPWVSMTAGDHYDTKPRWSTDGKFVYFLSSRGGSWNVWRRAFDAQRARPSGALTQVSFFDSAAQAIDYHSDLQFAVSANGIVVPVTSKAGAIWIVGNADE